MLSQGLGVLMNPTDSRLVAELLAAPGNRVYPGVIRPKFFLHSSAD
jgi:hypothetical protein